MQRNRAGWAPLVNSCSLLTLPLATHGCATNQHGAGGFELDRHGRASESSNASMEVYVLPSWAWGATNLIRPQGKRWQTFWLQELGCLPLLLAAPLYLADP